MRSRPVLLLLLACIGAVVASAAAAPVPVAGQALPEALPPSQRLVGAASDSGAVLSGIAVTNLVSDDLERPGPEIQTFRAAAGQVVIWTRFGGQPARRSIFFRWGRPDRSIYREVELVDQCPCLAVSRWPLNREGPNGGDRMLDTPGVWQVDIYVDNQFLGAVQFRVES